MTCVIRPQMNTILIYRVYVRCTAKLVHSVNKCAHTCVTSLNFTMHGAILESLTLVHDEWVRYITCKILMIMLLNVIQ